MDEANWPGYSIPFTTKFTGRGLGLAAIAILGRRAAPSVSIAPWPWDNALRLVSCSCTRGLSEAKRISKPMRGSGTILVIDDDDEMRHEPCRLEKRFEVLSAENGQVDLQGPSGRISKFPTSRCLS
jgi:hypothetical protein